MHVITSGSSFLDIDAYAGCIGYAELLTVLGQDAVAASSAPLNESITPTIRSWGADLKTDYSAQSDDVYTLVDVSDPAFFDPLVVSASIVGIIDHHTGFESQWNQKLGKAANIDFIGAACTLVYEAWVSAGKLDEMSQTAARLLVCGILDNTLNFRAGVTTDRDHVAYAALLPIAELPADWPAQYFSECQQSIEADIAKALRGDVKTMHETEYLPAAFGQLVVWDAQSILDYKAEIADTLKILNKDWLVSIVSLHEGCNYFMTTNEETQAKFMRLFGYPFEYDLAKSDRLLLRKEIIKRAQQM